MKIDPQQINHLIASRRSVFPGNYTGETVDHAIIVQMLENANWAPTHGLTEPWRFVVFSGEGRQKLANFQSQLYKEKADARGDFDPKKFNMLATKPLKASHVIAIGMKRSEEGKVPEIEEIEAVACAVQNMALTAAAYGLGAYWGSGGITYVEDAKAFFGLGAEDKLLGFLFVGIPKSEPQEGKRTPVLDKTTWIDQA
ncbi:MAG: nitroreductase [Cyclobacteriaceae bacterium]|nr:nitroreductase [Cyclobacteriaceae bacterium]